MAGSTDELYQLVGLLVTVATLAWSMWEKLAARRAGPVGDGRGTGGGLPTALVLAGLLAVVLAGCSSTPQQVAYKTLATVGHTEAAAMQAAAALQVQGKLGAGAWDKIAAAHDKFTPAYGAAITAARLDYSQPANATVVALAQTVIDLVSSYQPR